VTATAFHKGGTGEPLVLLHGFSATWRSWTPVLPALEEHHAVFAPTALGHYGGRPFAPGEPASIDAVVEAIERQMDAEGIDRAHIAGNSMGGWLSLELALRGRARSVVCVCPAGGWERDTPEGRAVVRFFRRNELALRIGRPWFKTIARRPRLRAVALRDVVARPSRMDAALALANLEGAAGCAVDGDEVAGLVEEAGARELGPVECPVRIALGTRDRLFDRPEHFAKLRRLLPDAEWVSLEGLGHAPMSDDPVQVSKTILEVTAADRLTAAP
jgi:pimeloyl-ACP methyl ester carboxylesterase